MVLTLRLRTESGHSPAAANKLPPVHGGYYTPCDISVHCEGTQVFILMNVMLVTRQDAGWVLIVAKHDKQADVKDHSSRPNSSFAGGKQRTAFRLYQRPMKRV